MLIGPFSSGLIDSNENVEALAEIGVVLVLFTIGLEFSLARLNEIRRLIIVGGSIQVVLTTLVTAGLAAIGGVAANDAIYTGLLVALSSTAIVLKLLRDRGESSTERGQAATGVLLFQDLAVVFMVLLVPVLGGDDGDPLEIVSALGRAVFLVVAVLVVARRVMPPVLDVIARTCSPEVFLLSIVAVCFGTALASSALGVSVSLGAFLAGLVVSESRHRTHAFGEILPLQILFSATFFVSVGTLLDLGFLVDEPLLVIGAIAGILVIKALTGAVAIRAVGASLPAAAGAALLLTQVGEFSFVLDNAGRDEGLSALGLGADGSQALIAATVVLLVATPGLAALGARIDRSLASRLRPRVMPTLPAGDASRRRGHALVAGYGTAARSVVGELRQVGIPFTVLTLSPDGATQASSEGVDVVIGDYAKRAVLVEAGIADARLVVIADDDVDRTTHVVALARSLNPTAAIVTRPLGDPPIDELAEAGADHVVTSERASQIGLGLAVRAALGLGDGRRPLSSVVRFEPDPHTDCPHVGEIRPVQPSAYGCEDCLRIGSTWVHLRICLECGHVGCCDSSEHRHARVHSSDAGHPIIGSLEPGEDWGYCFFDDLTIDPRPKRPAA